LTYATEWPAGSGEEVVSTPLAETLPTVVILPALSIGKKRFPAASEAIFPKGPMPDGRMIGFSAGEKVIDCAPAAEGQSKSKERAEHTSS
jgi:hypothetical protein